MTKPEEGRGMRWVSPGGDVRHFAVIKTTLSDDTVWSDENEISRPGGEAIMRELAYRLRELGVNVEGPRMCEWFGWEIELNMDREKVFCNVQKIDDWTLEVAWRPNLFGIVRRARRQAFLEALDKVKKGVDASEKFTEAKWFTYDEIAAFERGEIE